MAQLAMCGGVGDPAFLPFPSGPWNDIPPVTFSVLRNPGNWIKIRASKGFLLVLMSCLFKDFKTAFAKLVF